MNNIENTEITKSQDDKHAEDNLKNVLYVEDDNEIIEIIKEYFEKWSNEFILFIWPPKNGLFNEWSNDQIVTEFHSYLRSLDFQPDIVLLDIMLGEDNNGKPNLGGYSIIEFIKKNYNQIPIVTLTILPKPQIKPQILELTDEYLQKPFTPEEMHRKLRLLDKR